jgi:hypothetical protein
MLAGTAVVNPIIGFSYQDVYYELPKIENLYAVQLKDKLTIYSTNWPKTHLVGP